MSTPWQDEYNGTKLHRLSSGVYSFETSRVSLDADGAPNAYNEDDSLGLDLHANAGYPNGNWRDILVCDPGNPAKPYWQSSGLFAGYFIGMTALSDGKQPETDPARYVDATAVPYIVFPGPFHNMAGTGSTGDLAMIRNQRTGVESSAIVADVGPDEPLGEMSLKLAVNLGGQNPDPKNGHGAPVGPFRYVIFPRSRATPKWPLPVVQIDSRARACLAAAGGWSAIDRLYSAD